MPTRRRDPRIEFGERVRAARLKQVLTQEELAYASGLHPTYVSSVERGQRNISLVNIVRLASALQSDPGDLMHGLRS